MRTLTGLGLLVACAAGLSAETVLVSGSNDNLYSLDPTTGALTLIGAMGLEMYDIAFTPTGALYGVGPYTSSVSSNLYSINPNTAGISVVGSSGADLNSLDISVSGTAYATKG
jgi:hypothetical protein